MVELPVILDPPAILGSFVSAVALEDHSTAIQIAEDGLKAQSLESDATEQSRLQRRLSRRVPESRESLTVNCNVWKPRASRCTKRLRPGYLNSDKGQSPWAANSIQRWQTKPGVSQMPSSTRD